MLLEGLHLYNLDFFIIIIYDLENTDEWVDSKGEIRERRYCSSSAERLYKWISNRNDEK